MGPSLPEHARRELGRIFGRGGEDASRALSRWLGRPSTLRTSDVSEVDLADAAELLGPAESLVACCSMALGGRIAGLLLLAFEDRSGLALVDLLLRQPRGTSTTWGDLERSAANETANVVGCAFLNSLAEQLPSPDGMAGEARSILPSPPTFRHEFAGCLLQFALMEQALDLDRLVLVKARFEADDERLEWTLLLVPTGDSLGWLASALGDGP